MPTEPAATQACGNGGEGGAKTSGRSRITVKYIALAACAASLVCGGAIGICLFVTLRGAGGEVPLGDRVQPNATLQLEYLNNTDLRGDFLNNDGAVLSFNIDTRQGLINLTRTAPNDRSELLVVGRAGMVAFCAWQQEPTTSWVVMNDSAHATVTASVEDILHGDLGVLLARAADICTVGETDEDAAPGEHQCTNRPAEVDHIAKILGGDLGLSTERLSIKLAAVTGVTGGDSGAAARLYLLARQIDGFNAGDAIPPDEVSLVNQYLQEEQQHPGQQPPSEGRRLTGLTNTCGNACYGMCGRACDCWRWVCNSCDCRAGCRDHDYYCSCLGTHHQGCWSFRDIFRSNVCDRCSAGGSSSRRRRWWS